MTDLAPITISFENPTIVRGNEKLPLFELSETDHVHGRLNIDIGGRTVPHLGFSSPDDVCFNAWLEQLWLVSRAFREGNPPEHTFDEGEEGQPSFVFVRKGDIAYLSIEASEFEWGAEADEDWQKIVFDPFEFIEQQQKFRREFGNALQKAAPAAAQKWLERFDPRLLHQKLDEEM